MRLIRVLSLLSALALAGGIAHAHPIRSLDGAWDCVFSDAATPPGADAAWSPGTVPSTADWQPEGPHTWWFRKRFYLAATAAGDRVVLKVGGAKYGLRVFVNGQAVGEHVGGFAASEYDITDQAVTESTNELMLAVQDWTALLPAGAKAESLQQVKGQVSAPLGPSATEVGIWDGVTLEFRPRVFISEAAVITSVREGTIRVMARVRNEGRDNQEVTVTARLSSGGGGPQFDPAEITVPAGQEVSTTLAAEWRNAELWSPQDPHLYTLVVGARAAAMADALDVRFGFREFWAEGDVCYLNAVPLHLLGVSAPQPVADGSPAAFFRAVTSAGANAVVLGGQPWPEDWYDAADAAGVLVVAEGAISEGAAHYALGDASFWTRTRAEAEAMVRRLRNHPSIVIWSAEHGLLASGGGKSKETVSQVVALVQALQEMDETRPVMCRGDGDGGGSADLVSLEGPHELPRWTRWPETAQWFGAPVPLDCYPWSTWRWTREQPLSLEGLTRIPPRDVAAATVLYGDAAYTDPDLYRTLTETTARAWQVIAARDAGVSAITAWAVSEVMDPASPGRAAMLRAYRPIGAFDLSANAEVFAGRVAPREICVVNDTMAARRMDLRWRLAPASGTWKVQGTEPLFLPPASHSRVTAQLALPPVKAERVQATFTLELVDEGRVVFSESAEWTVFGRAALSGRVAGAPKQVAVYDPRGETARLLSDMGIHMAPFDGRNVAQKLRDAASVVIGKGAFSAETETPTGPIASALAAYVRGGGTVLVFEQSAYPTALLPITLAPRASAIAFARDASHPTLQGLAGRDLAHWLPDGAVNAREIAKPAWGGFRAIVDSGGAEGLATAGLAEVRLGRGRLVLCQLEVTSKYGIDPIATRLARNLLACLSTRPAATGRVGMILDAPAKAALAASGAVCQDLFGQIPEALGGSYQALIIGDPAPVQAYAGPLRAYVKRGGRVVFHRVTPATVEAVTGLTGLPLKVHESPGGVIALTDHTGLAAGLSAAELNWYDPSDGSASPVVSPSLASHVVDVPSTAKARHYTEPSVLVSVSDGKGLWIFDQVRWEDPGAHRVAAERYLDGLLMNVGAAFSLPAARN